MLRLAIALVGALLIGGCAGLSADSLSGQTTSLMTGDSEYQWSDTLLALLPPNAAGVQPLRERVTDPQLAELIDAALVSNPDLEITRRRLAETRALADADLARFRPGLTLSASVTDQTLSETGLLPAGRIPGFETSQTIYDATFDARWELGVFGRREGIRQLGDLAVEARGQDLVQAQDSLVAEVARRYIEFQQAARELKLLEDAVAHRDALYQATQRRREQGEASQFDVAVAQARVLDARARLPAAQRAQRVAGYQLAVLTGREPGALDLQVVAVDSAPWTSLLGTHAVASDVLRRRPDVRLAEIQFARAVREEDLAARDFYPRLTLFASAGPDTASFGEFLDSASLASALGVLLDWALIDGGRRAAQRDAAVSRSAQASSAYRQTLLAALLDVETQAARLVAARAQRVQHAAIVRVRESLVSMAERRFEGGTVSRLTLIEARHDQTDAHIAANRHRANEYLHLLGLEKSLGLL